MTTKKLIIRHVIWAIIVGIGAVGVFFVVPNPQIIPIAVLAIVILLFGSMSINHMSDEPDSYIEED